MATKRKLLDEAGEQPSAKQFKPSYVGTVEIVAGTSETLFEVHEDILSRRSDFFKAACSSVWTKSKDGIIKLPTIEPGTTKLYIHWAYSGTIDLTVISSTEEADKRIPAQQHWFETGQLFRLYVAADMFLDQLLKNKVMDALLRRVDGKTWYIHSSDVTYAWENTTSGSMLRRCILHWTAAKIDVRHFARFVEAYPSKFVADLAVMQLSVRGQAVGQYTPSYSDRDLYYEAQEEPMKAAGPS
ncbi:hypothetical protein LTR10_011280 [Elasticomyces elasticus]|nr:hypothetical protein LTR10_011280 [Elasticomyces elasticus]KAK4966305.1 Ankyrin repeat and BTB/POZ domain-containing protein 1 [Elasticomyces elasticus]